MVQDSQPTNDPNFDDRRQEVFLRQPIDPPPPMYLPLTSWKADRRRARELFIEYALRFTLPQSEPATE